MWMSVWRVEPSVLPCLVAKPFFGEVGPWVSYFNLPTWDGTRLIRPLSEGEEAPKEVYLALVEKVQVLRDDHAGHAC
jgi:hypothetical protein